MADSRTVGEDSQQQSLIFAVDSIDAGVTGVARPAEPSGYTSPRQQRHSHLSQWQNRPQKLVLLMPLLLLSSLLMLALFLFPKSLIATPPPPLASSLMHRNREAHGPTAMAMVTTREEEMLGGHSTPELPLVAEWTLDDMRHDRHPNLEGYIETRIKLAREGNLCLQPTEGQEHSWECSHLSHTECVEWREKFFEGLDIRYGWEFMPASGDWSPCGCDCCRRFLEGKPDKGRGLHVRLWPCQDDDEDQIFYVPADGGVGHIRQKRFANRCLTVSSEVWPNGHSGTGHLLMLWYCGHHNWNGQTWVLPTGGLGHLVWHDDHSKCADGQRLEVGEKWSAELQIWDCDKSGQHSVDQTFVFETLTKSNSQVAADEASPETPCVESNWPMKDHDLVCGRCQVPVKATASISSCSDYCHHLGRFCLAAAAEVVDSNNNNNNDASSSCPSRTEEKPCQARASDDDDDGSGGARLLCTCGERTLRGGYGSLTEFWVTEGEIRKRIQEMHAGAGVMEFALFGAFEGFSNPPKENLNRWTCKIEDRPVQRAALEAAVDEVKRLGGRTWLVINAAATDPNDDELSAGHVVLPPAASKKVNDIYFEASTRRRKANAAEESYMSTCGCSLGGKAESDGDDVSSASDRLMDVVVLNAAWGHRIAPRWAQFAKRLGVSGIHWNNFGDLGHCSGLALSSPFIRTNGKPVPDVSGFLQAALPVLRRNGLLQTFNFVDGTGWDPALVSQDPKSESLADVLPVVAFPYWEVWSEQAEDKFYKMVGRYNPVLAMYPGYSKYHCCAENEQQNADEYGIEPFDLGLKRWERAQRHNGSYHFLVDGLRFVRGPFVADGHFLHEGDLKGLEAAFDQFSQNT